MQPTGSQLRLKALVDKIALCKRELNPEEMDMAIRTLVQWATGLDESIASQLGWCRKYVAHYRRPGSTNTIEGVFTSMGAAIKFFVSRQINGTELVSIAEVVE